MDKKQTDILDGSHQYDCSDLSLNVIYLIIGCFADVILTGWVISKFIILPKLSDWCTKGNLAKVGNDRKVKAIAQFSILILFFCAK